MKGTDLLSHPIAKVCAVAVLTLFLLEVTWRVYFFGIQGLGYSSINSTVHIWNSGLARASEQLGIFYELRPNLDTQFRLANFRTNSAGLRDQEYSLEKPPDTFRVVVIGSSWTMPSGVPIEDAFHTQLEDALNQDSGEFRYEFINFAVEHYGLREMLEVLEHRAMAYDPDLILVATNDFTARVAPPDEAERLRFAEAPIRRPFFVPLSLRFFLQRLLGTRGTQEVRRVTLEMRPSLRQLGKAFAELKNITSDRDVPVLVTKLGYQARESLMTKRMADLSRENGFYFVDTGPLFKGVTYPQVRTRRGDNHPNGYAHGLFADSILAALHRHELLEPSQ